MIFTFEPSMNDPKNHDAVVKEIGSRISITSYCSAMAAGC